MIGEKIAVLDQLPYHAIKKNEKSPRLDYVDKQINKNTWDNSNNSARVTETSVN